MTTNSSIHRDRVLKRMEAQALALDNPAVFDFAECKYPNEPRWRLSTRWIEFDCIDANRHVLSNGCRAERFSQLVGVKEWDPVIFNGLPEQALYDYVCDFHAPAMNKRIGMGGVVTDFASWRRLRRNLLIGKA